MSHIAGGVKCTSNATLKKLTIHRVHTE